MARLSSLIAIASTAGCVVLGYQLKVVYGRIDEERGLRVAREREIALHKAAPIDSRVIDHNLAVSAAFVIDKLAGSERPDDSRYSRSVPAALATANSGPARMAYRRAQLSNQVNQTYGPLLRKLVLLPQQENAFVNLLIDRMQDAPNPAADPDQGSQSGPGLKHSIDFEDKIAAVLGKEALPTYKEYERTLYARQEVDSVDGSLVALGLGLSEQQRDMLTDSFIEERDSLSDVPPALNGTATFDDVEKTLAWQGDYERRLLERAEGVLTEEQFKYVRAQFERTAALRRTALAMQRENQAENVNPSVVWYPAK